jgi:hypothetical protein
MVERCATMLQPVKKKKNDALQTRLRIRKRVSNENTPINQSINSSNLLTISFAFTSTPHSSIRYRTTSKFPFRDAKWRGVQAFCNTHIQPMWEGQSNHPRTKWCRREHIQSINQSINQNHSHRSLHSHQPHISQSGIAPRPNVYTAMPSAVASNQSATLTLHAFKICNNNNNQITRQQYSAEIPKEGGT